MLADAFQVRHCHAHKRSAAYDAGRSSGRSLAHFLLCPPGRLKRPRAPWTSYRRAAPRLAAFAAAAAATSPPHNLPHQLRRPRARFHNSRHMPSTSILKRRSCRFDILPLATRRASLTYARRATHKWTGIAPTNEKEYFYQKRDMDIARRCTAHAQRFCREW